MISLYLDEDATSHALVTGLRTRGFNLLTALEAETLQKSDEYQLSEATKLHRVFYTFNVNDFPRIHADWVSFNRRHGGIIIGTQQQFSVGEQIRQLIHLGKSVTGNGWINRLEYLSNW